MIWIGVFFELLLLVFATSLLIIVMKLLFVKGYCDCPPYIPSFGQTKKEELLRISDVLSKATASMTIIDPGCGTAELIISLAKKFPQNKFVGIEWNKTICSIAKMRCNKLNNIEIICDNFFNYPFNNADIIVCFLMEPLMERFGKKVKKDCHKGVIVYSNTFKIPNLELIETVKTRKLWRFGNLHIYKV